MSRKSTYSESTEGEYILRMFPARFVLELETCENINTVVYFMKFYTF